MASGAQSDDVCPALTHTIAGTCTGGAGLQSGSPSARYSRNTQSDTATRQCLKWAEYAQITVGA
jgi:hypothetical protein